MGEHQPRPMALSQAASQRAWEETKGAIHSPIFWGIELVGGAIVTAGVLYFSPPPLSQFPLALYQALAPVSYIIGVFILVFLARLARAPYVQRDEARASLTGRTDVELLTSGNPTVHKATGHGPYGDYLVISGVDIINHRDSALDCVLKLEVIDLDDRVFVLGLENSTISNLSSSLPRGWQGDSQLTEPIRIESNSRAVGCAVFEAEVLANGMLEEDAADHLELTLRAYDGVDHLEVAHEDSSLRMYVSELATIEQLFKKGRISEADYEAKKAAFYDEEARSAERAEYLEEKYAEDFLPKE